MAKKKIFKTDLGGTSSGTDPEALFRDLRGRSPEIKHLWSHQADLLRDYHRNHLRVKDVAIELPTGAGKTLVGLLIAEFRRQNFKERVAYVCPTRQLARQVGAQASKYGIKAHVFVGKQRDYPPKEFSEFQESKALAITTYSSIFNSYPRIRDAHALILDDAHASENYIASMWSVEITWKQNASLYQSLVELIRDSLPLSFYSDIIRKDEVVRHRTDQIEMLPGKYFRKYIVAIRDLLDANLELETSPWYAWGLIKEHLKACCLFISFDSFLIRPLIPPTLTHTPFSQVNQRVYMSATLGAGGELERITGVTNIKRVPIPAGWEKRGSGRRLFILPQVTMSDEEAMNAILDAVKESDRSLILSPSQHEASVFIEKLDDNGVTILDASDIEDSIEPFTTSTDSALVLSRYDGLDLPDDTCRLLVMGGLPSGTNLQERFLWTRVAAFSLLRDRVLTRFTQGVGRCTRSDNDYAVVFIWGRSLVDFILKHENRCILNPELQAELEFGIENSKDKKADDFKALWQAFIEQGEDWEEAEEAIVHLRDKKNRQDDLTSQQMYSVVADEVSYLYSLWKEDFEAALEHARKVVDALSGDETKGYRGWWYYLVADAAMALYDVNRNSDLLETTKDYLKRASACCVAISWFAHLARSEKSFTGSSDEDELTAIAIENIRDKLTELGAVGNRFEHAVSKVIMDIKATKHNQFHQGLKSLGEMLGFRSELPNTDGAPDCIWSINNYLYIVHEAKSEHTPSDPIGINDIRQAQSHEDWIRGNRTCEKSTTILSLIISPRTVVASEALPFAKSLCHFTPDQLETLCNKITSTFRRIRSSWSSLSGDKMLEYINREIIAERLTPSKIVKQLSGQPVNKMKTNKGLLKK